MRKVFKYALNLTSERQQISIPAGRPQFLKFESQGESLQMWWEVAEGELVPHFFYILGTGHPIPEKAEYRGTAFLGSYEWHLYEDLS